MTDYDDPNNPDEPDESDVCPHGKGFSETCSICDDDDEYSEYVICPECGRDDVELVSNGDDEAEYECNYCGAEFVDGEDGDEGI